MSRDRRRDYEGDVIYEVWRSGGNPDAVDRDRVRDAYDDRLSKDEAVAMELRHQRPAPDPREGG